MKINFEYFQINKLMSQTVTVEKVDKEMRSFV